MAGVWRLSKVVRRIPETTRQLAKRVLVDVTSRRSILIPTPGVYVSIPGSRVRTSLKNVLVKCFFFRLKTSYLIPLHGQYK